MPDAPQSFRHQPTAPDVELLAGALDDLVDGIQPRRIADAPLAHLAETAKRLQRIDGVIQTATGPIAATRIDADRKARIWEDLMNGSRSRPHTMPAAPASARAVPSMNPWVEDEEVASLWGGITGPRRRASSTRALRFIPDFQPTTTFLMVIALLIAIGAGFSSLGQPGGPGITPTASATGDRGIAARASPEATAGIDAPFLDPNASVDCPVEPRSQEEVAAFLQDPGPVSERAYLPTTDADPTVAMDVAQVGRSYPACGAGGQDLRRTLETPRKIHEDPANSFYVGAGGRRFTVSIAEQKSLSEALLDPDPRTYVIQDEAVLPMGRFFEPGTPVQSQTIAPTVADAQIAHTMLPSHMVRLADGRIGGPIFRLIHPDDADLYSVSGPSMVDFVIFAPDASRGGRWAVDEELMLCAGDCDVLWVHSELQSELYPASPVAQACPVAPLTTEQTAAIRDRESPLPARQYAPVTTADTATARDVRSAFDLLGLCAGERERDPSYAYAFMTDRHIQELPHGEPWTDQIERRRAVSAQYGDALLGDQPSQEDLDLFLNIYAAQDHRFESDFGIIGETDRHPQIVRLLPDGRAALYSAEVWLNRTGAIRVPGAVPGREVFFYTIFANQNGSWLVDESLAICLGDCDSFWTNELQAASSPEIVPAPATPSGTPVASPAAIPAAGRRSHGAT